MTLNLDATTLALLPVAFVGGFYVCRWFVRWSKDVLGIEEEIMVLECSECAKCSTVNRYGDFDEAIRWSMTFAVTHARCKQKGKTE